MQEKDIKAQKWKQKIKIDLFSLLAQIVGALCNCTKVLDPKKIL